MKRVLIVSYQFPPFGGGAVARIHGFAKYLPAFDCRPLILSVDPSHYESHFLDESLLEEYGEAVAIHRTSSLEPGGRAVKDLVFGDVEKSFLQKVKLAALRWGQRHVLIPDRWILWYPYAVREGRRLAAEDRPDAVLASTPPASNIAVGAAIARKAGLPLIADYRDLWTGNPFFQPATRFRAHIERRLERRWVGRGAAVLATTREMASQLRHLFPALSNHILYLPNGFDPEKHRGPLRQRRPGNPIRFVHTGALTVNRSPRYFLRALAGVVQQRPDLRVRIDLRFYGFLAEQHRREIESLGLADLAADCGFVTQDEAIRVLREETDAALIFQRRSDGGETAVPGKLYDYLAAGCRVLAMCDPGATTRLLGELGVGCVTAYEDEKAIARAIVDIAERIDEAHTFHLPETTLAQFDRKQIAHKLATVIDDVSCGRPPAATGENRLSENDAGPGD